MPGPSSEIARGSGGTRRRGAAIVPEIDDHCLRKVVSCRQSCMTGYGGHRGTSVDVLLASRHSLYLAPLLILPLISHSEHDTDSSEQSERHTGLNEGVQDQLLLLVFAIDAIGCCWCHLDSLESGIAILRFDQLHEEISIARGTYRKAERAAKESH